MIGTGVSPFAIALANWAPGGGAATAPALPHTATSRWHPQFSDTTTSSGRMVTATDLEGLAGASEGGSGIGPEVMTDGQGKTFWRFSGAEYADIATTLSCDARDMTIFMVARVPKVGTKNNMFGLGSRNNSTQANTNGTAIDVRSLSNNAGFLYGFGKAGSTAASDEEWMIPGAQKQVIGINSKSGGQRMFINERFADVAVSFNTVGATGAEIGRYPFSPGSSGNWGKFDLYEMIVYAPGLSDAEALEVSQSLMTDHGIDEIEHQLILEGDSIMQGTGDVVDALSPGAILTEPGAGLIPSNWRVINYGTSGNQVPDLVDRRDAAISWTDQTIPGGQNVMAFEIGRNDWPSGGGNQTAQQHYDNVVAYLNTPTDGILQKGWSARVMANIGSASALMPQIIAHRANLRDTQFLTDVGSMGQVSIVSTDLIEHGGETRFVDDTDASNTTYYAGDNTHPNVLGAEIRMTGGDTPEYGVAYGFVASVPVEPPTVSLDASAFPDIDLTASAAGTLYYSIHQEGSDYTAQQVVDGDGVEVGNFAVTQGANAQEVDMTGVADGSYRIQVVLLVSGTLSASAGADVTWTAPVVSFSPTWMQFPGNAWVERNSDLTGAPATTQTVLAQMVYSPDASVIGTQEDIISSIGSTNKLLSVYKNSNDNIVLLVEDNTNTRVYTATATGDMVADGEYSILISMDGVTNGLDVTIIDLADGTVFGTVANTTASLTFDGTHLGWVIGAANGNGTRAIASRLERVMVWMNAAPDVSTAPVQAYFVDGSDLRSPADVVTSVGATPIINISGADIATGTNAGSGGNFVTDGAGTITEA